MEVNSIVVLGSGLAGYSFVKEFRQLNADTPITVITADRGDYYSKPQLSTALAMKRTPEQLIMHTSLQMAEKFNITVIPQTRVTHIDHYEKKVMWEGGELSYAQLVLALGAEVIHLPLVGNAARDVISVNSLEDYERFRDCLEGKKKVAIIGSGLVGCEFANDLAQSGCEIEMVSLDPYPLSRFVPEKVGRVLQHALSVMTVNWHLSACIIGIHYSGNGYSVELSDGRSLEVEAILSAVGLRPAIRLAEQSGLVITQGIAVDRHLRTSDAHVYALGDCASVNGFLLQYIAPLLNCARALAKTLSGTPTEVSYPAMPIVVKTPACSLSIFPPLHGIQGAWCFEGDELNIDARFYDTEHQLRGFALSGTQLSKRVELIKQLPHFF